MTEPFIVLLRSSVRYRTNRPRRIWHRVRERPGSNMVITWCGLPRVPEAFLRRSLVQESHLDRDCRTCLRALAKGAQPALLGAR